MTAADTFREIDNQIAQAKRALDNGRAARGHVVAAEILAGEGLRDALANEPKLEAFDELLEFAREVAGGLDVILERINHISKYTKACDAIGCREHEPQILKLRDGCLAAIAKTKQQTGEPT